MHDIRAIRADPDAFAAAMRLRGVPVDVTGILNEDRDLRESVTALQALQTEKRGLSKQFGEAKRRGEPTDAIAARSSALDGEIAAAERASALRETALRGLLETLPNVLDADVPEGADESGNVVLATHGEKPVLDFDAREHDALGETLRQMDFARAARLAGARFTVLRGALARMERALGQFMIDLHTRAHGYTEVAVPVLVNDTTMYGTGQLPKFAEDLFRTTDGRWLIPTAEVSLTNLVAGEILSSADLPLRMTALTDCFRSEAGASGRDTRGMLRQHQFRKVELVSITHPDDSEAEHERLTAAAEAVLGQLGLTFRRVLLCAGDTGFAAAKTYDLEVWLPGQGAWREISSCSNCRAFQARRMGARVRLDDKTIAPVHTLNGSGVAVGRALIAVMETYQQADGTIAVPDALRPYMPGVNAIAAQS